MSTNKATAVAQSELTRPARGQGTSKSARYRRNKAARKAAHTAKDSRLPDTTVTPPKAPTQTDNIAGEAHSSPSMPKESPPSSSSSVVEQALDNLLEMIRQERQALLDGPRITIFIGNVAVKDVAKRAAMAASSVLHNHFTKSPESVEYHFSKGYLQPGAVGLLLVSWMKETCGEFEACAVPFQKTFNENVAVLRAARRLGMERYTKHILAEHVDYLKTYLPSYDEIVAVEQNATTDKDPLWTGMVNHLCHDRYKGLLPDPEEFETFLEKHPHLKKAMESADAFFEGSARKKWEAYQAERRERWEMEQAERHERLARERGVAESLKQKLNTKGSGLMTVTAEEAAVLRGR